MRVTLREVPLKGGEFNRITLDIYHSKNQRERKATKLQVYAKPTKPMHREHNSEVRKLAEKVRAKTLLAKLGSRCQINVGRYPFYPRSDKSNNL